MPWVRLDDEFPEHPKLISVGPLGMALQVAALCYSNAHLTDGFIQFNVVNKLLSWEFSPPGSDVVYNICLTSGMSGDDVDSKMIAGWLVDAGIWELVPGGYIIHDYTDYQMTKEEIYALHETRTAVGKMGGRPKKNQIKQMETNLVSKTEPNGNQTLNQNESKTKPQSQSQSPSIPNIDNSLIKVEEGAASDELDTTPISPLDWDREEEEPFYIVKRLLETLTGIPAQGKAAIDSIDKIVEMGANGDDIRSGLKWFLDQGKPLKYYSSLVGPITTEKNKRIQSSNGHKPSEHVFNEVYQ